MKHIPISYRLACLAEHIDPADCFDTGDADQDAEIVADIRERSERNEWAWCCVRVDAVADLGGVEVVESEYLGGCSYDSAEQFKADTYYSDMCNEARERLLVRLESVREALGVRA